MLVLVTLVILQEKDGIRGHADANDGEEDPDAHESALFFGEVEAYPQKGQADNDAVVFALK